MDVGKHTPGEWTVNGPSKPNGRERSIDYAITDDGGSIIAESFGTVAYATAEGGEYVTRPAEANARLIASAPDLLEALQKITNHFSDVMRGPMIQGAGVTFDNGVGGIPTIAQASAAIAKALGEAANAPS